MQIRNTTRGAVIASEARTALSAAARMRGMLGRNFGGFDALVFPRNGSVHMFFMHMPLDILFLDGEGRVCGIRNSLKPWRMAFQAGARTTVELPAGVLAASGTRPGDRIVLGDGPPP